MDDARHRLSASQPLEAEHQGADLRSRLLGNLQHSAAALSREAMEDESCFAPPSNDGNVIFAEKVAREEKRKSPLEGWESLPRAELLFDLGRKRDPIDGTRLDHVRFNPHSRYNNAFDPSPRFERRCDFCGAHHCSRFLADSPGHPNCVRYREQRDYAPDRRLCRYRRCRQPADHHTLVCPSLHARCGRCGCRGHTAEQHCDTSNTAVMARLRADFEDAADEGFLTRRRFKQLAWGWYPYPLGSPHDNEGAVPPPVSYNLLTSRPVMEATLQLRSILSLPQHQGYGPPPLLSAEQVAAAVAQAERQAVHDLRGADDGDGTATGATTRASAASGSGKKTKTD